MEPTHAVVSFAVLGALLTVTPGLGTALVLRSAVARRRFRRTVDAGTGVVLIGLGLRLSNP